jgi:hypothetical protein
MDAQLHLITTDEAGQWRLDTQTVEVGRRGIALARAALRDARRQQHITDVEHPTAA